MTLTEIGKVTWNNEDIRNYIDDFLDLYKDRPIKNNQGGMLTPHCFATYFIMKILNKPIIVESGIWKGQSTWLLEKTCPNSKIISIDPNLNYREYISPNVEYKSIDWKYIYIKDPANTICFFDDHQNAIERIKTAVQKGFKHLIFEDNYPLGQGDCVSLKQSFYNNELNEYLREHIKIYYEFPPVFKTEYTRWKDMWNDKKYPTKSPIFNKLDNTNNMYKIFEDDAQSYTWIAYVELY